MKLSSLMCATALAVTSSPAWAASSRVWISGHGTDQVGCGAPTAPCRSLQYAHDNAVVAGGEIDILDPAGYGAVTITKAISIVNDGVGTAGVQATTGSAVTVNASPSDAVTLRGLDIEGVGADLGVSLLAGGALTLQDCSISGFTTNGLQFEPTAAARLLVSNVRISHSGVNGALVSPQASGGAVVEAILTRVEIVDDQNGLLVDGHGGGLGVSVAVTLADSVVGYSSGVAVGASSDTTHANGFVIVRNSTLANNQTGVEALQNSVIDAAHSTFSGNHTAFLTLFGGVVRSFGDNDIDGADANLGNTPTPLPLQ